MRLRTTITCPFCSHVAREEVPDGVCLFFYQCTACRALLGPKPGDCCVFCWYGERRCPTAPASYQEKSQ